MRSYHLIDNWLYKYDFYDCWIKLIVSIYEVKFSKIQGAAFLTDWGDLLVVD